MPTSKTPLKTRRKLRSDTSIRERAAKRYRSGRYTYRGIARQAGINHEIVRAWLTGQRTNIHWDNAVAICRALGISIKATWYE